MEPPPTSCSNRFTIKKKAKTVDNQPPDVYNVLKIYKCDKREKYSHTLLLRERQSGESVLLKT
jgi:hypothetical protein